MIKIIYLELFSKNWSTSENRESYREAVSFNLDVSYKMRSPPKSGPKLLILKEPSSGIEPLTY